MTVYLDYLDKFTKMREIGKYVTECFDLLNDEIKPGVTTEHINQFVKKYCEDKEIGNSQKGYQGFPAYCCTSLNEVLCHGIPTQEPMSAGDIISVDLTFNKDGFHADACRTYPVGNISEADRQLVNVARGAMQAGIAVVKPGEPISKIGEAIKAYVDEQGYTIASHFVGHGISRNIHEWPSIGHTTVPTQDAQTLLVPGMTFTIEPIIIAGSDQWRMSHDKWTVRTRDRRNAAQFETTLGITEAGYTIFCN